MLVNVYFKFVKGSSSPSSFHSPSENTKLINITILPLQDIKSWDLMVLTGFLFLLMLFFDLVGLLNTLYMDQTVMIYDKVV